MSRRNHQGNSHPYTGGDGWMASRSALLNQDDLDHELSRVLLVGEGNPQFPDDPSQALVPWAAEGKAASTASGYRLMGILGLTEDQYLACHRTNLCQGGEWSNRLARDRAVELLGHQHPWNVVVALGKKVQQAFRRAMDEAGDPGWEPFRYRTQVYSQSRPGSVTICTVRTIALLPHPSGLCREWNLPESTHRARALLAQLAPKVPWGGVSGASAGGLHYYMRPGDPLPSEAS